MLVDTESRSAGREAARRLAAETGFLQSLQRSEMRDSEITALQHLIESVRRQGNHVAWAAELLRESAAKPEDAHFLIETLSAAGGDMGSQALESSEVPRCSFCLKSSRDVKSMVTSPNANICDECCEIALRTMKGKHSSLMRLWRRMTHLRAGGVQP
jgi:hypothetical protein